MAITAAVVTAWPRNPGPDPKYAILDNCELSREDLLELKGPKQEPRIIFIPLAEPLAVIHERELRRWMELCEERSRAKLVWVLWTYNDRDELRTLSPNARILSTHASRDECYTKMIEHWEEMERKYTPEHPAWRRVLRCVWEGYPYSRDPTLPE
jgi:hypothetical protein